MKFVLVMIVALLPGICAGETLVLSLDKAISIAMEKNRDIEKAREYAHYVHGKYLEERAAALPQFSINGYARFSRDGSQGVSGLAEQRSFGRGIDLTISQPIYTWGKLDAAVRAAEVGLKTADEQLRLYRQNAFLEVSIAFYDILLAKELQRLALENRGQKQRHLDEAKNKYAAGVATDYDVLAAEVSLENTAPEVVHTENVVRMAREQLRFLLALSDTEVDVEGSLETAGTEPPLPVNFEESLLVARKRRPELADLRLRIGIYNELVTIANAENKPRLDLKGGSGWHWTSLNGHGSTQDDDGAAWNAGIYLTFPFFDGMKTSGKTIQARSDLQIKHIEESRLLNAVALEVRQAGYSLQEAARIFTALTGTVKQAERLLQMAEKGYEFGVKIKLEVDDAQLNLLKARSSLSKALRDYRVAQVGYLRAIGVAGE